MTSYSVSRCSAALAARVLDRQHQPAAETIVGILVLDGDAQPRLDQLGLGELRKRGFQRLPPLGRIAEAEALDRMRIEAARRQVGARLCALG
jgi:hypothetical protein